ncbi:DEKNAAC101613 [Brettanomyces naardenensis]|uniref:DEKNAAC101613 n=1 Tax=Brettanomyces naardenensis TaxID=13370 RepID=A0A448YIK1_BRENA|nr:DEKNAAC101613 [Brettanomyces naardenensis]
MAGSLAADQRLQKIGVTVSEQRASSEGADSLTHALAGGFGGMVALALTYPLANLATNAQAKVSTAKEGDLETEKRQLQLKTLEEKLRALQVKVEGLYGGLSTAMIGIVATNFVYYYFYELTGKRLRSRSGNSLSELKGLTAKQSIIAGLVGGIVSRTVTNPIWVANTKMAVAKGRAGSTFSVIRRIVKEEGWKKLFAGLTPALALVLNPVIQYTIFEQLKTLLVSRKRRALTAVDALYLGALGKIVATLLTYPSYTVRSRMHVSKEGNKSMIQMMIDIFRNEGVSGFYGGLGLKLIQGIVGSAFLFYFKEEFVIQAQILVRRLRKLQRS